MNFLSRLSRRIERIDSHLCVGLDPRPERIDGPVLPFLRGVIEQVRARAAALKPNIAYFEAMGVEGYRMLETLLGEIPDKLPVILDVKRSDIPETQSYYARAYFEGWDVDAVTLNPYCGSDSLQPFLEHEDRGIYLLGVTSNPGFSDIQSVEGPEGSVFERVAGMTGASDTGSAGLVLGLTNLTPGMAEAIPDVPLLIPGLGAQGGKLQRLIDLDHSAPILVNSSRSVVYAEGETGPGETAEQYREKINDVLE